MHASTDQLLLGVLAKLDVVKGPNSNGNYTAWCVFHEDGKGKPPHQPNLSVSEKGFYCFACGAKGSLRKLAEHLGVAMNQADPEKTFDYTDESSKLLYQVVRFPDKKFLQRRPNEQGSWIWNLDGTRRVLYKLPDLVRCTEDPVYLVEGEKDVETLFALGLLATTNSGGAGKWRPEYSETLKGRDVIILPDNDKPGRKHGLLVANCLLGIANSVKKVELPDLKEKGDVTDWLYFGHTKAELLDLVAGAKPIRDKFEIPEADQSVAKPLQNISQADQMVRMVLESDTVLFTDQRGEAYAQYQVEDHKEIRPIDSRFFKRHLSGSFYGFANKVPGSEPIKSALRVIDAEAHRRKIRYRLFNRVAKNDEGLWYDLSDEKWRAIRITPEGWSIHNTPPILFRRYAHQSPQITPLRGGNLEDIFNFINMSSKEDRLLLSIYIVCCYVPGIPHPVCFIYGPQGSAKTTTTNIIRQLIDPSECEVLAFPKDEAELVQCLSHHWTPYFDNTSKLPDWASDALCRAATGEGYSKRQLFTNDDDFIYSYRCCPGLNGINLVAKKPDLLDRGLLFELEPISKELRRSEKDVLLEFQRIRPMLLGAIFDLLAMALSSLSSIQLTSSPRMADFALWGTAIAQAMGYPPDSFDSAYSKSIDLQTAEVVHGNVVASMISSFMESKTIWKGSASELLVVLCREAEEAHFDIKADYWPKAPHSLTRRLNEIIPNLAAVGIRIKRTRSRSGTDIEITNGNKECSFPF